MSANINSISSETGKKHLTISMLLLGGLLFLRLPFFTILITVLPKESTLKSITFIIYCGGTYLLTAILIWWEREHLRDFWIDIASAITFLCQIFVFPIGIVLFWAMRRSQTKFPAVSARMWFWAWFGAVSALALSTLTVSLGLKPTSPSAAVPVSLMSLVLSILVQMTNATVWEEPLFRGFLWGYLRRWHWPNGLIWIFQAALFTLAHAYNLNDEAFGPWLIRFILPSLLYGLIAWRAQSIFASMVTHGVFNASVDMLFNARLLSEAVNVSSSAGGILIGILTGVWVVEWLRQKRVSAIGKQNESS
jgi:membrane protease YdiL (CAAX protease family)